MLVESVNARKKKKADILSKLPAESAEIISAIGCYDVLAHTDLNELKAIVEIYGGPGAEGIAASMALKVGYVKALLDRCMSEFDDEISNFVWNDPEVEAKSEAYNKLLDDLKLDLQTLDPIFCSINAMAARITRLAYKKGFLDSLRAVKTIEDRTGGAA